RWNPSWRLSHTRLASAVARLAPRFHGQRHEHPPDLTATVTGREPPRQRRPARGGTTAAERSRPVRAPPQPGTPTAEGTPAAGPARPVRAGPPTRGRALLRTGQGAGGQPDLPAPRAPAVLAGAPRGAERRVDHEM